MEQSNSLNLVWDPRVLLVCSDIGIQCFRDHLLLGNSDERQENGLLFWIIERDPLRLFFLSFYSNSMLSIDY